MACALILLHSLDCIDTRCAQLQGISVSALTLRLFSQQLYFRFSIRQSAIGNDGIRVSPLILNNLNSDEDGLKVRCNIAYQADTDNHFFGATVTSGDMILKIAQISSLTVSDDSPINGATITLTCTATGEAAPTFTFTTGNKKTVDSTFFEEVEVVPVETTSTTHVAKYVTKTIAPNVLRSGTTFKCEVSQPYVTLRNPIQPCLVLPLPTPFILD